MGHIDELDLCKLIANELADHGPHDEQEVYGMLILLLRLRDERQNKVAETTQCEIKRVEVTAPSVNDITEQAFRNTPPVNSFVSKEYKPVVYSAQSKRDTILAPTKMSSQDRDALHIRILDLLETAPLTTRQIATRLGVAIDDMRRRDKIQAHIRWLQRNGYIIDTRMNSKPKRHALWQVAK